MTNGKYIGRFAPSPLVWSGPLHFGSLFPCVSIVVTSYFRLNKIIGSGDRIEIIDKEHEQLGVNNLILKNT